MAASRSPRRRRVIGLVAAVMLAVPATLVAVPLTVQAAIVSQDEAAPAEDQPAPAQEEPAPGQEEPAPAQEEPAPAQEEPAPAQESAGPDDAAANDAAPQDEEEPTPKPSKSKGGKNADDGDQADPSDEPSPEPSDEPSIEPSDEPSVEPSVEPSDESDFVDLDGDGIDDAVEQVEPTDEPTEVASEEASMEPSVEPTEAALETETTEQTSSGAELSLDISDADGVRVSVRGSGLMPASRVEVWVFSTPQLVTSGITDDSGSYATSVGLPSDLGEGEHTVVLKGTDIDGNPVEIGSGVELGPNGELLAVSPGADITALVIPQMRSEVMAPPYPTVIPLDQPEAVVTTTIAAFALLSVTGVGLAAAGVAMRTSGGMPSSRSALASDDVAGGGVSAALGGAEGEGSDVDTSHNRGWRTKFTPVGVAPGDTSALHSLPGTSFVDEASFVGASVVASKSPLLARGILDAAPLRAMFGSASLLLPLLGIILGIAGAVAGGGIAQPPALGIVIALMVIGVLDALSGAMASIAFAVTVAVMGGIIDWSSVRTLMGMALLIAGPGLIAASFRVIRHPYIKGAAGAWERLADFVVVPLLGAYTTYNIVMALPPLGGAEFPIASDAALLACVVAAMLIVKVLLEEIATRWFPERMATIAPSSLTAPGTLQLVISPLIKVSIFLFVSAAFVGTPWQLWVAGALFVIPALLAPFASRWPNSPRLWQVLPQSLPYMALALLIFLVLSALLFQSFGDTTQFALMAFFILMVPDFIVGLARLVGREPADGEVRWYMRPKLMWLYRIGGVVLVVVTTYLAWLTLQ